MSKITSSPRLSHLNISKMKKENVKIAALTSYDFSFANLCQEAGVDIIFVGDSLGMVIQGHDSTIPVELGDIIYHTKIVAKGSKRPLIISDLPFATYQESPKQAFSSAAKILKAGAQVIKLEGGEDMASTTEFLSRRGVAVCSHIGLTPQSINQLGRYGIHGKNDESFAQVKKDAFAQQQAGAVMIVLEALYADLAEELANELTIPTIGIGAGPSCSGQVLVIYDILNITMGIKPKFVKDFMQGQDSILSAIRAYVAEVKDGTYPATKHLYR
ncbi:MAG: 3-methyl-2-oxobutanoate hydroxymethyltransferase [SAR324 cluster bacterium]|nr:3-methyl-2-oxobutanoate hydroxymethyltransferase [SAR324 cluster bacterium]